jgi:hypothetical protein
VNVHYFEHVNRQILHQRVVDTYPRRSYTRELKTESGTSATKDRSAVNTSIYSESIVTGTS